MSLLAARARALLSSTPTGLHLDGRSRPSSSGLEFPVLDPATGATIASVADATPDDGVAALDAAVDAGPAWAATPPRDRAVILRRAFDLVVARREELALLMTLEMGKPLAEARAEVDYGAEFLRWFSEEAVRIAGRYAATPTGTGHAIVARHPVGPCLLITPWNFPLAMATRKIGPALAAGCTVVLKPAAATPLTAVALAAVLDEAGLPAGVCNVVPTSSSAALSGPLLADPRLRKLSFTGSTAVGRALLRQAAQNVVRVSMELGGNAPFVVFDDADPDAVVEGAMAAKFRNTGQACTAANRFLVHEDLAPELTRRLGDRVAALRMGPGTGEGVTIGPLIDDAAVARCLDLVDDAVRRGARVVTGGRAPAGPGSFLEPTLVVDVPQDCPLVTEEIFGPVLAVSTFADEAEAIRRANATPYGLAAYAYTRDLDRATRLIDTLETGLLGLNAGVVSDPSQPFGGTKHSGIGHEGGPEGIGEYLTTTYALIPS